MDLTILDQNRKFLSFLDHIKRVPVKSFTHSSIKFEFCIKKQFPKSKTQKFPWTISHKTTFQFISEPFQTFNFGEKYTVDQ